MKRSVLALLVTIVGCGSFLAEPDSDSPPDRDAGATPTDSATPSDGGGPSSGSKNCSAIPAGAIYCEDFAKPKVPSELVPDGGTLTTDSNSQINGPAGDPARVLQLSAPAAETGAFDASALLVVRFFTAPPPKLRVISRVRLDTPGADVSVDTLSVGLVHDDGDGGKGSTQIFTRIIGARVYLGEFDTSFTGDKDGERFAPDSGELTPNVFHELRVDVEIDEPKATLFVDGNIVSTRSLEFPRPVTHSLFNLTYGLYSRAPRPALQVTIDDVEARAF